MIFALPGATPCFKMSFVMPSGVASLSLYLNPVPLSVQHALPAQTPPAGIAALETKFAPPS